MAQSLPYMFLTAAIGIGLAVYLVVVMDAAVAEITATSAWTGGSADAMQGRDRVLAIWDHMIPLSITAISITVLWASRRRGAV